MTRSNAPATLCVHAGHRPDGGQKSLVPPIVRSTTFLMDEEAYALRAAGRGDETLIYARETNPTLEACQRRISALEGADSALLFASGMAAMHALLLAAVERGAHVVTGRELYGGTRGLLGEIFERMGVEDTVVDACDSEAVAAALRDETRLLLIESIANPTIAVADVPRLAELAHARGVLLAVDATFATPILQRPLALGADVVHHSATKYLGGHSDVLAGALAFTRQPELARAAWHWRTAAGGCTDPEAAAMVDRGLKTLHLRMRAHSENATRLAVFLGEREEVVSVNHTSVPTHPTHEVAARVLTRDSGMLSFVIRGGDEAALRFARGLELIIEAASLGGVESLVSVPGHMSHVHFTAEERIAMGIPPGLVRLSVGVEEADDLIADVAQALVRAVAPG